MSYASEEWHDKCRSYLQRNIGKHTIDHHIIGANVSAVGQLTFYDSKTSMKKVISQPDIIVFDNIGRPVWLVEYKTGVNQRRKAEHQLRRDQQIVYSVWRELPRMIYATGTPNSGYKLTEVIK